jgi:hypothetical protein
MSFIKHIFNRESLAQVQTADVQRLVDNEIEESLHLDFEEISKEHVKYDGLAQHVSGFLNTSGGVVVFGLSERKEKGRNVAYRITWATIKKESVENNLYQRVDPWCEDIQIHPVQNPNDPGERIFVILVPKSKNPPHMANHRYHIRLNFQTRPMGHEQVSNIFKQVYLQKYDVVNTVYGPIYSELASYLNHKQIEKWDIEEYAQICNEKRFLLDQEDAICDLLDDFYNRVSKRNKALEHVPFRMAEIINKAASNFFGKPVFRTSGQSAIKLDIKSESTQQLPHIDSAILNKKDPLDFWKENYPFDRILESQILLEHTEGTMVGQFTTMIIPTDQFKAFLEVLKKNVEKDELIQYIWKESDDLRSQIEYLLSELSSRM